MTVHLDAKDATSTVVLHVGDRLRVDLPSAPATGFRWKAKLFDASHLQWLGKGVRPDSGRLDAAGVQVFVWKAILPGAAAITLSYGRPDEEKTVAPAKQASVSVEVVAEALEPPDDRDLSPPADDLGTTPVQKPATYTGALMCGDCIRIDAELTLYGNRAKDPDHGVFVEKRRYLGAPGGDRTIAGTGRWTVLHGTYADPGMTVYILAAPGGGIENLKLDGNRLVLLDEQMLPIPNQDGTDHSLHLSP